MTVLLTLSGRAASAADVTVPGTQPGTRPAGGVSATAPSTSPATAPAVPAIAPVPSPPAAGQVFASLYAKEYARVSASRLPKEAGDFAWKLVEAGRKESPSPGLQLLLLERGLDLAIKDPTQGDLAIQALEILSRLRPDYAFKYDERSIPILEKQAKTASGLEQPWWTDQLRRRAMRLAETYAMQGRLDDAAAVAKKAVDAARNLRPDEPVDTAEYFKRMLALQAADRRVRELRPRLEGATVDQALCREIIDLLVAVLNRPEEAIVYARRCTDLSVASAPSLAAAIPAQLTDEMRVQLALYYRAAADRLTGLSQQMVLRRASYHLADYLASHFLSEERERLSVAAQAVSQQLEKFGGEGPEPIGPLPAAKTLLPLVDLAQHKVPGGDWTRKRGISSLTADAATDRSLLWFPVCPGANYQLAAEFEYAGSTGFGITLPVGGASVTVLRQDTSIGLSTVGGNWRPLTEQLKNLRTETGRHLLHISVAVAGDKATLLVSLDQVVAAKWEGKPGDLAPFAKAAPASALVPALFVRDGRLIVHRVDLKVAGERVLPYVAGPSHDLPTDGSRPADAAVSVTPNKQAAFAHNRVAFSVDDQTPPRKLALSFEEPTAEVALFKKGFLGMMSSTANVAELRLSPTRYYQLLDLVKAVPRGYTDAELSSLGLLFKEYERSTSPEAVARAERTILLALHCLGDRYRRDEIAWAKRVTATLTVPEAQVAAKFAK